MKKFLGDTTWQEFFTICAVIYFTFRQELLVTIVLVLCMILSKLNSIFKELKKITTNQVPERVFVKEAPAANTVNDKPAPLGSFISDGM